MDEGFQSHVYDALFDLNAVLEDVAHLRQEHGNVIAVNRALLKLRGAFGDLNSLLPTPLSLPPHQSR